MRNLDKKSATEIAAEQLRAIVLAQESGALIGSEEALTARLGCSRSTVRQVARLLEREGLLRVRRGINGGYFGSRPDAGTVEANVAAFLETLQVDKRDIAVVASALWVEAMRKAAAVKSAEVVETVEPLLKRIRAVKDSATFEQVRQLELQSQAEIFKISNSNYIKLIFDINIAYSRRTYVALDGDDGSESHSSFVKTWRDAKILELNAVLSGDRELAVMASQYSRKVWYKRMRSRFRFIDEAAGSDS